MTTDIRADVVERIELYANALDHMEGADVNLCGAHASVAKRDAMMHSASIHDAPEIRALLTLTNAHKRRLRSTLYSMCEQYGRLLARDVIAPVARGSGDQPVIFITGNAMMPPMREVEHAERVWTLDTGDDTTNATAWEVFVQAVDHELGTLNVCMEAPEYDNALYVVDLSRFEHVDPDELPADADLDLSDEWRPIAREGG